MANNIVQLQSLQSPGDIVYPEGGSRYEQYKEDGLYEYPILPNGRPNKSHVKITYNQGDVYDGGIKRGKQNGSGKYFWKEGGSYEGNFERGKMSGNGKYTAVNGDVYEGNFKDNKYDGVGKYTWSDGSSFEGKFKNGKMISGRFIDEVGNEYNCKFIYKLNGEHKHSVVNLVRRAKIKSEVKAEKTEKHEEKTSKKKVTSKSADGLLSKDKQLITQIRKSKRGADFKNLYSGAAGKSDKSEKQLIAIIGFFNNSDAEQIQRILQSSKIYDATKGKEHYVDLISGVIKNGKDFSSKASASKKSKQSSAGKTNVNVNVASK